VDCPNCGATLRERDRAGIKVDFCPDCKGVWLDRGELDKIIQRELGDAEEEERAEQPARAAAYEPRAERRERDDDDDEYRSREYGEGRERRGYEPRKSKKRSFFESLTEMVGGESE
jgi:Zn-finger nucleic acid-binding protein